jgi:hypothetical protein
MMQERFQMAPDELMGPPEFVHAWATFAGAIFQSIDTIGGKHIKDGVNERILRRNGQTWRDAVGGNTALAAQMTMTSFLKVIKLAQKLGQLQPSTNFISPELLKR